MTHEDDFTEQVQNVFRSVDDLIGRYGLDGLPLADSTIGNKAAVLMESIRAEGLRVIRTRRGPEASRVVEFTLSGLSFLHTICSPASGGCGGRDVREVIGYRPEGRGLRDTDGIRERGRLGMCAACGNLISVF